MAAVSEGFLTSVYAGGDIMRPTFFELIAQEQLMDALRPAVRFLAGILAERAPSRALPLIGRWQEVYSAFLLILEGYHLRIHGATFAEHFFGLQRQPSGGDPKLSALEVLEKMRRSVDAPPLTTRQWASSLAIVVVWPWVRSHCEERFRAAENVPPQARSVQEQRWVRVYPWVHALHTSLAFAHRLLYLLEVSDVWSPWLRLLGLRLVRHFPQLPVSDENHPQGAARRLWNATTSLGAASLWGGVYLMQFLSWWYQREHLLQPYRQRKAPPPPPLRPPYQDVSHHGVADVSLEAKEQDEGTASTRLVLLPQDRRVCPLCHRIRRNPAISSSGHVFCYPCLVPHVQRFGICPVTGLPMTVEQVRRLRESSS
eukprot:TRINITY_DN36432_c1_g1_i1.p1 TRINITY_DN36432_c1_g1~~TRINITY_DN36432_c1_g1_i1.p1  ORF type:complete len:370 (+),score=56.58 TRINITY_DN36432_c1_g1_i1:91-1200(+)